MSRSLRKQNRLAAGGFAFLWVLAIVLIIGIGLATGAEMYRTSKIRDSERDLLFVGDQFRQAIQRYFDSSPGGQKRYPTSLEDLLDDPRFPDKRRHLRKLYPDPITGQYEWGLIMVGGGIAGVHSLSEQRPLKTDNFNTPNTEFVGKSSYKDWVFTHPANLLVKPDGHAPPKQGEKVATEPSVDAPAMRAERP